MAKLPHMQVNGLSYRVNLSGAPYLPLVYLMLSGATYVIVLPGAPSLPLVKRSVRLVIRSVAGQVETVLK